MYPYRVFVSYAREDGMLAEKTCEVLRSIGLSPFSDQDLPPGEDYISGIKALIDRMHLFMPVLTERSSKWVHEEVGYAIGAGVPVMALVKGVDPGEMLTLHQAVKLPDDLSGLRRLLERPHIQNLISKAGVNNRVAMECADDTETRARILAEHANNAYELDGPQRLRIRAVHTSFSIPDAYCKQPIWAERDWGNFRGDSYHTLQREERKAFQRHASENGCDLLIDPTIPVNDGEQKAQRVRLGILREFLRSQLGREGSVRVASHPVARGGSLIIVGDWFYGESMSPSKGAGYRQTVFSWHAPRVLRKIQDFDEMFNECYDPSGSSIQRAVDEIEKIMAEIVV